MISTSWQRISYSIAIPSTATEIGFYWQANVAGTAGANDWFEITGVQLELGSVLTNFSRICHFDRLIFHDCYAPYVLQNTNLI